MFGSCGLVAAESDVPLEVTGHSASSAAPVRTEEPAITSRASVPALLDGRYETFTMGQRVKERDRGECE